MAQYFLHLRDFGGDLVEDEEGMDFPAFAAARDYAIAAMRELVSEAIKNGQEIRYEMVVVADEQGSHLASVPVVAPLPATLLNVLKILPKWFRQTGSKNIAATLMAVDTWRKMQATQTTRRLG